MEQNLKNALVLTKEGYLQGSVEEDGLKVFKGVPYAAPPIGERRFRAPEDHGKWRGIRDATKYGAASIQQTAGWENRLAFINSQYEEDCLYLNIWTPANSENDKLPVFMWIHGGGLVAGSGVEPVCNGENLARNKNMVVVTINYRLGFFGFFAHPDLRKENPHGTAGNYAFLDMRKAAMWIKDNIAAFGGDPDNLTIAGQSGGAAAVGSLLVSPLMKGLAKRVCIESGPMYYSIMAPASREETDKVGTEFMELAGCSSIDELRKKDAWELYDLAVSTGGPRGGMRFNFSIDGWFLPEDIFEMMDGGRFNDFDVMIGNTSQEFPIAGPEGISIESYESFLDETFGENADKIKLWYPAETPQAAAKQVATIASDFLLMGAVKLGETCVKYGRNAYVFLVSKEVSTEEGALFGSPHCAEMPYLFGRINTGGRSPFSRYEWQESDYKFMETIQGYWHNFAKTGNPNGEGLVEWKKFDDGDYKIMELTDNCAMIDSSIYQERYDLFKKMLEQDASINMLQKTMSKFGRRPF